jgi:phospholipid transport system substrate-binding protein
LRLPLDSHTSQGDGEAKGRRFVVRKVAFLVMLAAALAARTPAVAASPAEQAVEGFHEALLGVMKNGERLGFRGRYEALAPALARMFNLPQMARIAVGAYWDKFDEAQRRTLVDAFTRMTVATYADRFDSYSGEQFRMNGTTPSRGDSVVIATAIVKSDGEAVPLNYFMHPTEDGWKAVDVFLKSGISELATRRSEYSSILARSGFDALIAEIDKKVKSMSGG